MLRPEQTTIKTYAQPLTLADFMLYGGSLPIGALAGILVWKWLEAK
jgi:hypothetical protein